MNQKKKKKVDRGKEWDMCVAEKKPRGKKKKKKHMDDRWCEGKII